MREKPAKTLVPSFNFLKKDRQKIAHISVEPRLLFDYFQY